MRAHDRRRQTGIPLSAPSPSRSRLRGSGLVSFLRALGATASPPVLRRSLGLRLLVLSLGLRLLGFLFSLGVDVGVRGCVVGLVGTRIRWGSLLG
jgi:hypothetical protein